MPDFFGVYDDMKVIEYLEFFAAAYRIKGAARRKVCNDMLELVDLGYKRDAFVTSLSRGMTQRLGLARVAAARSQGAAAGRARQRARSPGPDRDSRAAQAARQARQDDHGLQPHPARAGRHLQQGRASSRRAVISSTERCRTLMEQIRKRTVLIVGVVGDPDPAARLLEQSPLVESVEIKDGQLHITLAENTTDYSDLPTVLIDGRLQAHALPRGRDQPGNGLHGADQGDHGVEERKKRHGRSESAVALV